LEFYPIPLSEKPFRLREPFKYRAGPRWGQRVITVPPGYRTDFATIPRFFHRVFNPVGRHGYAAVIHDWLCDVEPKPFSHVQAAEIFGEAMAVLGVPPWRIKMMVTAVKYFGPKFKSTSNNGRETRRE
jgi:hypothetical protein